MIEIFSMRGRLNRAQYIGPCLALISIGVLVVIALPRSIEASALLGFLFLFGVGYEAMCLTVRRLHDLGRPAAHFWLLLIPIYNIYLLGLLVFKKGTTGLNEYGGDVLATRQK